MIYHGHFTHPELWMMWAVVVLTPVNTLGILYLLWRRGR
jgi:hypothetical protein